MKIRQFVTLVIVITVGLLVLLLFKPFTAISRSIQPQSGLEPTHKISNDFGIVVDSEEHDLSVGYFVVRKGTNWVRFEAQNVPRTIPVAP